MPLQGGQGRNAATWIMPHDTWTDRMRHAVQDKLIDLKRAQEAISATGKQIGDALNAYRREELYHNRAAARVKQFMEDEVQPLYAEMIRRKVSQEDLDYYLWARHAEEANQRIARINPELPDGGSGMTTKDARAYLAGLTPQQQADFTTLAAQVDAIIQKTRDTMLDYKMISAQQWQDLNSMYQHYVPLHREGMEDAVLAPGRGQGYSVKGPEYRRRTGSGKPVVDVLAHIMNQREIEITRGEKTRVARAFYALTLQNQNPDFWTANKPPKIKQVQKVNGVEQVVEVVDPHYKSRDNIVIVKVPTRNGNVVERSIEFNERDPRAMRLARAIKNLDTQDLGGLMGVTASITRYFASINTQYNPIFGVVNLVRDTGEGLANLSSTPLAGRQAEVLKNAAMILANTSKHGFTKFSGEWAPIWDEFNMAGGPTGYRDIFRTGKDRAEAIEKALNPDWWQQRPWGKVLTANGVLDKPAQLLVDSGVRPLAEWLSDYNHVLENITRLAAYKAARDAGLSIEESASIAKNLTVNFNRKGEMTSQIGMLYAFFNAATQGIARMSETLAGPAGAKIIGGGLLLGAMQAVLLAALGFDDDDPPQFVRERNLVIPWGSEAKNYTSIPLPLGFNVLPNIGRLVAETMLGGDPKENLANAFGVIVDTFNPLGGSAPVAQILAPTPLDPLVALSMNEDWTSKPIAREDFSSLNPTPGFTRKRDSAGAVSIALARLINRATGGTEFQPGMLSPTPDQIEYLAGQVTGGVGREVMKTMTTLTALVEGEELPAYKIPLVGRFYGQASGQASQGNRFYANLKRINMAQAEVKGLRDSGRGNEAMRYIVDNPHARLYPVAAAAERRVSKLRSQRRAMKEQGASKAQLQAIDNQITEQMKALNDAMKRAG